MIYIFKDLQKLREKILTKKVVFVSGCFDILHRGHVEFLTKAASYGDVLVVGIMPAQFIKVKKNRKPTHSQVTRALIINSLKCVDHVVLTPYIKSKFPSIEVLRVLRPSVFFREEKKRLYLPVADELKKLHISYVSMVMPKLDSTTRIIKRIKASPRSDKKVKINS